MQLKDYQHTALEDLRRFMARVAELRDHAQMYPSQGAFEEIRGGFKRYERLADPREKDVPFICIQVPTGGGKTVLAAHTVDIANQYLTKRKTGLVLWVVPTQQIYRQTIKSLQTKDHPYREVLDRSSGGRTLILEKDDKFTPSEVEENLVVLMLMMQSSSRETKETLRFYRASGFDAFFPSEDRLDQHAKLLKLHPNFDVYTGFGDTKQIIPSLGNTVRMLEPLVILDEGHKAKSTIQRDTLIKFNPRAIVEFTATPHQSSNVLVNIRGRALLEEEMIKLPLNVKNVATADWKDALTAATTRLDELTEKAKKLKSKTYDYIRPICVVQVERTGKDQRQRNYIHSEEVKEELIKRGVPPHEIAIQSSEKKELNEFEDVNGLLTKNNQIRYIITKDALKEGWDCSFAYVLCLLNTPRSRTGATQLIGRILRQPYAKKTPIEELNESYVISHKNNSVIADIQKGFDEEGLLDLKTQIKFDDGKRSEPPAQGIGAVGKVREKFKNAYKHFILPTFVIRTKTRTRAVDYEADIESRIDWSDFDAKAFAANFKFTNEVIEDFAESVTLGAQPPPNPRLEKAGGFDQDEDVLITFSRSGDVVNTFQEATPQYLAQEIMDIVPNAWMAYEVGEKALKALSKQGTADEVRRNLYRIASSLRIHLREERDVRARGVFQELLAKDTIRFVFFTDAWKQPKEKEYSYGSDPIQHKGPPFRGKPAQQSLFEPEAVVAEDFDSPAELQVALWLDTQDQLFFWYRNFTRKETSFFLQGWRPHKLYPDFVTTTVDPKNAESFDRVFIIETKGDHLRAGAEQRVDDKTWYIQQMFELCNNAKPRHIDDLGLEMEGKPIKFELVHYNSDEYKNQIAKLFEEG